MQDLLYDLDCWQKDICEEYDDEIRDIKLSMIETFKEMLGYYEVEI